MTFHLPSSSEASKETLTKVLSRCTWKAVSLRCSNKPLSFELFHIRYLRIVADRRPFVQSLSPEHHKVAREFRGRTLGLTCNALSAIASLTSINYRLILHRTCVRTQIFTKGFGRVFALTLFSSSMSCQASHTKRFKHVAWNWASNFSSISSVPSLCTGAVL